MSLRHSIIVAILVTLALMTAAASNAQIPQKMNYQVMLTDDADQPLANESVQLVFRIYNAGIGRRPALDRDAQRRDELHRSGVRRARQHEPTLHRFRRAAVAPGRGRRGGHVPQAGADQRALLARRPERGHRRRSTHSTPADGSPTDVVYVDNDGFVTVGNAASAYVLSEVRGPSARPTRPPVTSWLTATTPTEWAVRKVEPERWNRREHRDDRRLLCEQHHGGRRRSSTKAGTRRSSSRWATAGAYGRSPAERVTHFAPTPAGRGSPATSLEERASRCR